MKHCRPRQHSARSPSSNKLPSMPLGDPMAELERRSDDASELPQDANIPLAFTEIVTRKKKKNVNRIDSLTHTHIHRRRHTHTQMLPLGLSTSASHYSVTASRHRVMRSTAESQSAAHWEKRQRGRDRDAHTLYHVPRQSAAALPPRQIHHGGPFFFPPV